MENIENAQMCIFRRSSKTCFRKIEWNAYLVVCSFMSKRSSVERLRLTDGHFNSSNTCFFQMVISLFRVAGEGFEPTTSGLWARRASRLLYPAISIKNSLYSREINGRRRIRTFESIANRFTVCPLWPLGNPSIKPMIGLEPITCWLQISCSANWATSAKLYLSCRSCPLQ